MVVSVVPNFCRSDRQKRSLTGIIVSIHLYSIHPTRESQIPNIIKRKGRAAEVDDIHRDTTSECGT